MGDLRLRLTTSPPSVSWLYKRKTAFSYFGCVFLEAPSVTWWKNGPENVLFPSIDIVFSCYIFRVNTI
jgi:hypothetical protein